MALPQQVLLRDAGGDHAPRHQLVLRAGAVGVEMGVEAALVKGLQPTVQGEILLPGVKLCAFTPRCFQHLSHAAVAARQHRLQEAGVGVVPVVGDGLRLDGLPQQRHTALVLLLGDLGLPLEGGVGLGDEPAGGYGDADAALLVLGALPPCVHDPGGHVGNAQHILVRLRRQTQHEVQLHGAVPAGKGGAAALQQVVQRHVLIDHIPQALRTRLRRKGQAGLAALGQTLHQLHGEVVRPQGRQGQADMALVAERLQLIAQAGQRRVIAGGQAGQRHLLIAGVVAGADAVIGAQVAAAVAHRTVDVARLTEPAAPDTAAKQLQRHPILHDLRAGDDGLDREIGLVHIVNDALGHLGRRAVQRRNGRHGAVIVVRHVVQAGNVDAVQLGGGAKQLLLAPPLPPGGAVQLHQLHGQILALAQTDKVDEFRHRLGVVHGGAAGDDQR